MAAAAHLIVGSREEPFLEAMLASLEGVAQTLIVNDNSEGASPHTQILEASHFSRAGRMIVDRTPFRSFSEARNICLRLHAQHDAGAWVAFIDADEVHGPQAVRIASHLGDMPARIGFIDAYTWHFFQSFDWYTSIERRMMFFRFTPEARWEGPVHEQLHGVPGSRLVLPYVYAHYGHTLEPRRHAEKGRHYSALGAPGDILTEEELDGFDIERYFAPVYHRLMKFRGSHPPAAQAATERLRPRMARFHAITERIGKGQSLPLQLRNTARRLNYELRWRGRRLDPLARRLVS
jgi:hypothetical protein